jgi:carboxyl-terminal processing protease
MIQKSKLLIFIGSFLVVLYGATAAFWGKEPYKEITVFMDVMHRVRDDYVEVPNMNNVQDGAMKGLIDALDPYCSFLSKERYDELQKRKQNGNASTGIILTKRSDVIYIVSCGRDSAAVEAGIRPGDYLIAVNGQGVEEKSIMETESLLQGPAGSKIKVSVFRSSKTKPLDIDITLKKSAASPVNFKMLDGNIGLLAISSLSDASVVQAKDKLKTLISAGARKLILDLRDCADGNPSDGATLANFFMRKGVIYSSQNRKGEKVQVVEAAPDKFVTDLPMAVLIDSSTVGAAEIAAGALKDHDRAVIVGEKSFGIGSSQETYQLKSGSILILSTAKFYTPKGKAIQNDLARNTGIAPDIKAPDDDKRQELAVDSYYDDQDDVKYKQIQEKIEKIQLDKALDILAKESAPAKKAA